MLKSCLHLTFVVLIHKAKSCVCIMCVWAGRACAMAHVWAEDHRWQTILAFYFIGGSLWYFSVAETRQAGLQTSSPWRRDRIMDLSYQDLLSTGLGGQNSEPSGHMASVLSIETMLSQSICL